MSENQNEPQEPNDNQQEHEWLIEGEPPSEHEVDSAKKEAVSSFNTLSKNLSTLFEDLINIREGTDIQSSVESIKRDIDFKGVTVWILIFSIFIASIGLNTNSPAVVIGAMLISPLMGPIMGIGLALGTNDWKTLLRSARSLAIAVAVSVVTSTIYFMISPLHEASSELLARTRPTTLDVFVAIFGGLAGAIAASRKEKTNVVPGVAIATALMPPLCTAGYGLATFNFSFFFGAFYLFFLNSLFITVSTYAVVRYLRFPLVHFMDAQREKWVKRAILGLVVLLILPSGWIFYNVIKENVFRGRANDFVKQEINFPGSNVSSFNLNVLDSIHEIEVFIIGQPISERDQKYLEAKLDEYGLVNNFMVENTKLTFRQNEAQTDPDKLKFEILENIYANNEKDLRNKDEKIAFLEKELFRYQRDSIPFLTITQKMRIMQPELNRIGYARIVQADSNNVLDTIPAFMVDWNLEEDVSEEQIPVLTKKLKDYLELELGRDSVAILPY